MKLLEYVRILQVIKGSRVRSALSRIACNRSCKSTVLAVGISLLYAIYVVLWTVFASRPVPGWVSTIMEVIVIGGIELISRGIAGMFLSKVFIETKRKPNYILADSGGFCKD